MSVAANTEHRIPTFVSHVAVWALIAVLLGPHLSSGEFWWTDEARHAMGGIFLLDVMRDLPLSDPMGYALRYFGQYPALALNWYPPFFYFIEGIAYFLFGQHAEVARALVLVFCLAGASAWITWIRRTWGTSVALLSAALFLSLPGWNLWARSVMLEAPAIAMMILAVLCFERYLERPDYRRSIACGLVLAAGLFLKQTVVYILPALLAYGAFDRRRRALLLRQAIPAYAITASAIVAFAIYSSTFGGVALAASVGDQTASSSRAPDLLSLERWMLHPRAVADTWGWLGALSLLGAFLPGWRKEPQLLLVFAWIGSWYLVSTMMIGSADNASRYTMYVMPPLALLAVRPAYAAGANRIAEVGALVACCGLLLLNTWRSSSMPARATAGYAAAAEMIYRTETKGLLLYAGKNDGNFIYQLRALDERRRHVVLRGDKILVSMAVHKSWGLKSHVRTSDDVLALIRRFGVEYVVVERPDVVGLREFQLLNEALGGPSFDRVASQAVVATGGIESPSAVEVFRFREYQPSPHVEVVIPLPHLNREIRFRVDELKVQP